ncbi:MAG: hypothetical protein KBS72_05875 [Bacteroidales bacterium]|nr:hypothetical protein [Candidatus Cacconaster scatequi]
MDNEILTLLLNNNTPGISNPRTRESQIKLWNRCVTKWNKTHSATKVSLDALADQFHLKWPQIYVSISDDTLYCSFSYVDYMFHNNEDGQICGGMFIREGKKPANAINMTASQIVDLIGTVRLLPAIGRKINKNAYESLTNMEDDRCRGCSDPNQTALAWANRAWSLYCIGLIEETQAACMNSLLYKRISSADSRMGALEAEMYVLMGKTYYFTFQWELADYCFKESYNQYYKIFERPDWKDVLYADVPKEEREEYNNDIIGSYMNWATSYSIFLRDTGNESDSKAIIKRSSVVMNRQQ